MAFRVRKVDNWFAIWDDINCEFIHPEHLCLSEEKLKRYLRENSFPKDSEYSEKEMIYDLTCSKGTYIIPTKKRRTAEFIAQMISDLI